MEFLLDNDPDIWDTKSNNERTPLHTAGTTVSYIIQY